MPPEIARRFSAKSDSTAARQLYTPPPAEAAIASNQRSDCRVQSDLSRSRAEPVLTGAALNLCSGLGRVTHPAYGIGKGGVPGARRLCRPDRLPGAGWTEQSRVWKQRQDTLAPRGCKPRQGAGGTLQGRRKGPRTPVRGWDGVSCRWQVRTAQGLSAMPTTGAIYGPRVSPPYPVRPFSGYFWVVGIK